MVRLPPALVSVVRPFVEIVTTSSELPAKAAALSNLRIRLKGREGSEGFIGRLASQYAGLHADPPLDLEPLFVMELQTLVDPLAGVFLVVDDDQLIRKTYARFLPFSLKISPGQIRLAEHGVAALAVFDEVAPVVSAVVTDVNMPEMDGFELYQALRARGFQGPVIISSGNQQNEKEAATLFAGDPQTAFFLKPPDMTEMTTRIRDLLVSPSVAQP